MINHSKEINMAKVAVLAGANYEGTPNKLGGCGNDVRDINKLLKDGGFSTTILTDAKGLGVQVAGLPTRDLILTNVQKMITNAKPGDTLVFYYSGHGTQIKDDEYMVPLDAVTHGFNQRKLISSDDLHKLLIQVPHGVKLLMVADSCFSGNITHFDITAKGLIIGPISPFKRLRTLIDASHRSASSHGALTLIAGCKENQESTDLGTNGALTASIKEWITNNTLAKWFTACFDYTASAMSAFKAALTAPIKAQGITDQDPQISYNKDTGIPAHHKSLTDYYGFINEPYEYLREKNQALTKALEPARNLTKDFRDFIREPHQYWANRSHAQASMEALFDQKTLINSPALKGGTVNPEAVNDAAEVKMKLRARSKS